MSGNRLKKNVYFVGIGQVAQKLLGFILVPFAARYLDVDGFGQFSLASSVMLVVVMLNDWGVNTYITREVAKNPARVSAHLWNAAALKAGIILLDFIILLLYLSLTNYSAETDRAILIFSCYGILSSFVQLAIGVFQAFERMEFEALVLTLEKIFITSIGIFVLLKGFGLLTFSTVYVAGGLFSVLLSVVVLARFFPLHRTPVNTGVMSDLFLRSLPFGLSLLLATLYNYTGIFILSILKTEEAVGWFSAGFKLMSLTNVVPIILISAVYPVLSREIHECNRERVNLLYSRGFKYLLFLALPMVTGISLLSDKIVWAVFGSEYQPAIPMLRILSMTAALIFFNLYFTGMLKAANLQKIMVRLQIGALILNIVLNSILISAFSGVGAALTSVFTEVFIFLSYLWILRKVVTPIPFEWIWFRGLLATGLLALFLWFLPGLNLILSIGIGGLLYLGALFLSRAVTPAEFLPFREGPDE